MHSTTKKIFTRIISGQLVCQILYLNDNQVTKVPNIANSEASW